MRKTELRTLTGLAVAVSLAACNAHRSPPSVVEVAVSADASGRCIRLVDEKELSDEQLVEKLKPGQLVRLMGMTPEIPFQCVGPTIYLLQRARVPMKVGFVSEPPPSE